MTAGGCNIWYNTRMNVVLFFQSTMRKSWREKLAGAFRFARERGWLIQVIERSATPAAIRNALRTWRPLGCMVDRAHSCGMPPDGVFCDMPVAYLDQDPSHPSPKHSCVLHDSAATARLAAKELLNLGYKSCGFVGMPQPRFWSRERADAYREEAVKAGCTFSEFAGEDIVSWLSTLPKPCAVLAVNDYAAQQVHHAAQTLGLEIPDDIAIAGIDNDELYCEAMKPGLTSVAPDFEEAGYRLASLLADPIENPGKPPVLVKYGPSKLVRRGSTRKIVVADVRVRRALEFIRRNACSRSLGVNDVTKEMNCSRRLATLRFREAVGHSIVDEIHDVRFQYACKLLAETDLATSVVVSECGYDSESFFKKYFKQRTGLSMKDWRATTSTPAATSR